MWRDRLLELGQTMRMIKLAPPATDSAINTLRNSLGEIPEELERLLREVNGDNFVLLSIEQMIETNNRLRELEDFMPLDCLLFFANNGCGDYYGYQIRKSGINPSDIFIWNHEDDSRTWVADGLSDFLEKYCNGEI